MDFSRACEGFVKVTFKKFLQFLYAHGICRIGGEKTRLYQACKLVFHPVCRPFQVAELQKFRCGGAACGGIWLFFRILEKRCTLKGVEQALNIGLLLFCALYRRFCAANFGQGINRACRLGIVDVEHGGGKTGNRGFCREYAQVCIRIGEGELLFKLCGKGFHACGGFGASVGGGFARLPLA